MLESLSEHQRLIADRQAQQLEQQKRTNAATQAVADITKKSADVTQDLMGNLAPALETVDKLQKGKTRQEQLRGSGNFGDFLEFVGNEVRDPDTYTRTGRAKTLAETTSLMNVQTQVAQLKQSALQDLSQVVKADLEASGGQLALASLMETQSAERMTAEVARVEQQAMLLQQNRALAQQKLATMSIEETKAAAVKAAGGSIDVGGVLISAGDLEARVLELDNSAYLAETRQAARELKNTALEQKIARKQLENMNLPQLRELTITGSPDYNLSDINDVYKLKTAAQAEGIAYDVQMNKYANWSDGVLVPVIQDLQKIEPSIPKNSSLDSSFKGYQGTVMAVTRVLQGYREAGRDMPPEVIAQADITIQEARTQFESAITKEAKQRSGNDQDLENIYTEMYRGNPVPRASVEAALITRLNKGMPLTDVLPPETAKLVQQKFNTKFQEKMLQNQMGLGSDKTTLKQEAMQEAIYEGVQNSITGRTNELFWDQANKAGNPLSGILTPYQVMGMVAESDARGLKAFAATYQLDEAEMQAVADGNEIPGKVTRRDAQNLEVMQNQELLMRLDSMGAGKAEQYVDWWNKNGDQYVAEKKAARLAVSRTAGVQEAAMETYASDIEADQIRGYQQGINDAFDSYNGLKQQRYQEMISFDLKPEHRQAALLQFDESLSDGERKQFMSGFLLPLIREGQKNGLDFTKINAIVEQAIDSNVAATPEIGKLLKKVAKNRPAIVGRVESMMERPFWSYLAPVKMSPRSGMDPSEWLDNTVRQNGFTWYAESLKGERENARP